MLWGIPIRFEREYELLNIAAPVFGYGLIAILAGHIYSRYALWKLKTLTRNAIPDTNGEQPVEEQNTTEENGHG